MIYSKEILKECQPDMYELIEEHYQELTLNKGVVKLNPDWARYQKLEDENKLHIFTARNDGKLVGYSFFFLDTHIHYRDLLVATNDVLYLTASYRLGITGIRLIKYSEAELQKLGAKKVTWHIKESKDLSPILNRMGYFAEDTILGKLV
jgi:hypothetical protein